MLDVDRAVRASGSRFVYLLGDLVFVQFALMRHAMDILVGKGFVPVIPPVLVREEVMYGSGFLPTDEANIYRTDADQLYLVGTSEVPLAALHMGEIVDEGDLPLRYAGYSTCFRREAGTYGKDMGGMFRVHQFDKVEMFSFSRPDSSWDELEFLVSVEEEIVGNFDLPYRVVNIAAGDLGGAAAKKYDIEAWLPGQERYREITSCSNYTDYGARRAQTRMRSRRRKHRRPAHPERHGHRDRPHADRPAREPSAGGRLGRDARGAPSVPARTRAGPTPADELIQARPGSTSASAGRASVPRSICAVSRRSRGRARPGGRPRTTDARGSGASGSNRPGARRGTAAPTARRCDRTARWPRSRARDRRGARSRKK